MDWDEESKVVNIIKNHKTKSDFLFDVLVSFKVQSSKYCFSQLTENESPLIPLIQKELTNSDLLFEFPSQPWQI